MPRKKRSERIGALPSDAKLSGSWWRCERHGLTQDPILLGGKSYCPAGDCQCMAHIVHSVLQDKSDEKRRWNDAAA